MFSGTGAASLLPEPDKRYKPMEISRDSIVASGFKFTPTQRLKKTTIELLKANLP